MDAIPDRPRDKSIREMHRKRMFTLSGAERVQMERDVFEMIRTHLESRIRSEAPDIDTRALSFRIAERIHIGDPRALAAIAAMRNS